jgi:polysaccharide pyruvyl transferase WcaK-like protein
MWKLTPEHCAAIPSTRASEVVCTLTDYNRDPASDRALLTTLLKEYERVHLWIQGYKDENYVASLGVDDPRLTLVAPRLADFDDILSSHEVDYIGTRLHAAIRALQRGRRALIVAIDNRAREKHVDFNLDIVERGDTTEVLSWISGGRPVSLTVPFDAITRWKSAQGL